MSSMIEKKQQEVINDLRISNDIKDNKIKELEKTIQKQLNYIEEQKFRIRYLELLASMEKERKYGKRSDSAFDNDKIPNLFNFDNEIEEHADLSFEEPKQDIPEEYEEIQYRRKRRKNFNNRAANITTRVVMHELPEELCICPKCGAPLVKIGVDIVREVVFIPARLEIVEHHYAKYKCENECTNKFDSVDIQAITEPRAFPKTMAHESTVAHIIVEKFCKYVPLYRQEKFFNNIGIEISRQTLCNWVMYAGEYIKVLVDQMHKDLIKNEIVLMDETTTRVLDSKNTKSYIWLATSSKHDIPINLYMYKETREYHHAEDILKGGNVKYVQSDLYGAYGRLSCAIDVGCWAHAKRKFTDIYKVTQKSDTFKYMNKNLEHAIKEIRDLYKIEKGLENRKASIEEIFEVRQKLSLPKIIEFYNWCIEKDNLYSTDSKMHEALGYIINNIDVLKNYTLDGRLTIDNNKSERAAKTYKRGLVNWLFNITSDGADTSCAILSLVSTAIENGLNVYDYLVYLFKGMAKFLPKLNNLKPDDIKEIRELLPYSTELPESLKANNKKSS